MFFGCQIEAALKLSSFRNINIKQPCLLQIRLSIHHRDSYSGSIVAVPLSVIAIANKPHRRSISELNHSDSTYITERIPIRFQECVTDINEICIFKTTADAVEQEYKATKMILLAELLLVEGEKVTSLVEYQASTGGLFEHGFLPILFDSPDGKYTCSLEVQFHSQLLGFKFIDNSSEIQRIWEKHRNEGKDRHISKDKAIKVPKEFKSFREYLILATNGYQKEDTQRFYDKYVGELRQSVYQLKSHMKDYIELLDQSNQGAILEMDVIKKLSEPLPEPTHFSRDRKKLFSEGKESTKSLHQSVHRRCPSITDVLLSPEMLEESLLKDFNLLSKVLYELWRQYLKLESQFFNKLEKKRLVSKYMNQAKSYYLTHNCLVQNTKSEPKTPVSLEDSNKTTNFHHISSPLPHISQFIKPSKKHLIVLVHGFQACSFDMEIIKNCIAFLFPHCQVLLSTSNECRTEKSIEVLGERLAREIKDFVNEQPSRGEYKISFIAHSMGGIVVRAALELLMFYKDRFGFYVSLSSPHLGYLFHTSTLIQTSLWVLNKMNKCQSLLELTLQEKPDIQQSYLYRLSELPGLEYFEAVILQSSTFDEYVPYSSARLETCKQVAKDPNNYKSRCYNQMLQNIVGRVNPSKLVRINVQFSNLQQDFNTMIGRTAHIQLLSDLPAMKAFLLLISDVFR